jgi:GTP-binding protein HflX
LIASFKATLEEARQADLLIHVADASNPAVVEQISAVYEVLQELGIEEKDTLLALNKIDRAADPLDLERLRERYPAAVCISARSGEGLTRFAQAVSEALSGDFQDLEIRFPVSDGRLLSYLAQYGEVLSRTYAEEEVIVHCRLAGKYLGKLPDDPAVRIRPYRQCGDEASSAAACAAAEAKTPQADARSDADDEPAQYAAPGADDPIGEVA